MTAVNNRHRIILGTAQFGLDYGISNTRGQITQEESRAIIDKASKSGINILDTATAYGESEACIGNALKGEAFFNIITKFPPNQHSKRVSQAFNESLERLGVSKIYGYLLHSFNTYKANPAILNDLYKLKDQGKVDQIGISLYHPEEAETLLASNAKIDIVQLPYSVFDRRFEEVLPKLRDKGIETHARSIYLQGLYFMKSNTIPIHLQKIAPKVQALQLLAVSHNIYLGAMLMGFVLQNENVSNVVVGVESLQTLEENIKFSDTQLDQKLASELLSFKEQDENIILPYNWAKA